MATKGIKVVRKTGRCANGNERDGGRVYHALERGSWEALCGTAPGRLSGWSEHDAEDVTCPRCIRKLAQMDADDIMQEQHSNYNADIAASLGIR